MLETKTCKLGGSREKKQKGRARWVRGPSDCAGLCIKDWNAVEGLCIGPKERGGPNGPWAHKILKQMQ